MKLFTLLLSATLFSFSTPKTTPLTPEQKAEVIRAFDTLNYVYFETAIAKRQLDPNQYIDGKPLLIHAVINDQPEMVRLLLSYGARLSSTSNEGHDVDFYADKYNAIHAKAELIVIRA